MQIPIYQVDAFTSRVFTGNPAAVCPLERWLDDATMQAIAAENNLAETAFFVRSSGAAAGKAGPGDESYDIRWFTPTMEVDLCGHATLASAFVILDILRLARDEVRFGSLSGPLVVRRQGDLLALDFPADPPAPCALPQPLEPGLGRRPRETLRSARDYLAVFDAEDEVRALTPRMDLLLELDGRGVIVTAPGREADFVSRFFAPAAGVAEDPVTGSAHCALVPYWSERLGRNRFKALQVSARGGELLCEARNDRVIIAGRAVMFLEGAIRI